MVLNNSNNNNNNKPLWCIINKWPTLHMIYGDYFDEKPENNIKNPTKTNDDEEEH